MSLDKIFYKNSLLEQLFKNVKNHLKYALYITHTTLVFYFTLKTQKYEFSCSKSNQKD